MWTGKNRKRTTSPTSVLLSDKAKDALRILSEELGLNRTKVIEMSVRLLARKLRVRLPKDSLAELEALPDEE